MFVDREEEISELEKRVKLGHSVFILSLRGYGKTTLLKEFRRRMLEKGLVGIYINCLRIYSGDDMIQVVKEDFQTIGKKDLLQKLYVARVNAKEALESVFKFAKSEGISFLIFDELSALLNRFSLKKPYRGMGGSKAVAEHLKGLLDTFSIPIIAADTSLESIYSLSRDYSAPLFKEIKKVIFLEPLPLNSALGLIDKEAESVGIKLGWESAIKVAEVTYCVPQYIKMFVPTLKSKIKPEDVEEAMIKELKTGSFNAYFKLLFEKFSPAEQEILAHLSRKITRGGETIRRIPGAYTILEGLVRKGIVKKITKSERESHYIISDKVFEAWLQLQDLAEYRKISEKRVRLLSFGFEALIREALFALKSPVMVKDELDRDVEIGPYKKVERYEGALGEIDALAYVSKDEADVYEISIGEAGKDKVEQLLRKIAVSERMGLKVDKGVLIAYEGFRSDALKLARELISTGARIYLIGKEGFRRIARAGGFRIF